MRTRPTFEAVARAAFAPPSAAGPGRCAPHDKPGRFPLTIARRCTGVVLSLAAIASFAIPASAAEIFVDRQIKADIGANDGILIGRGKQWDEHPSLSLRVTPDNRDAFLGLSPPVIKDEVAAGGARAGLELGSDATAQIGRLRAYLYGDAFARNSNLIDSAGVTVGPTAADAHTTAGWSDRIRLESLRTPQGTPLKLRGRMILQSFATATVAGGPAEGGRTGTARARVNWIPLGFSVTDAQARLADASDDLRHILTSSTGGGDSVFDFELDFSNGATSPFGAVLSARGSLGLVSTDPGAFPNAGEVTASFGAEASRSLTWGGITGVVNAETGEPITDWTITSESGFDYSRPFAVPEPSSIALLLAAGLVLTCRARRGPRKRVT